jgi:uncharacterized protein DUF397
MATRHVPVVVEHCSSGAIWVKSSRSGGCGTGCVELMRQGRCFVRDSKDRARVVSFTPTAWLHFLRHLPTS